MIIRAKDVTEEFYNANREKKLYELLEIEPALCAEYWLWDLELSHRAEVVLNHYIYPPLFNNPEPTSTLPFILEMTLETLRHVRNLGEECFVEVLEKLSEFAAWLLASEKAKRSPCVENEKKDGEAFAVRDGRLILYTGPGGDVTIPSDVREIGFRAFFNCVGLTSVTISDNVESIGCSAFRGCSGLTSVSIGNGVTSIGNFAFSDCKGLTSVTIPDSVTSIENSAFYDCSGLTSVVWNATNCTSAGEDYNSIFSGCTNLTTVTIGDNVENIPAYAFSGCSGLTSVTIPDSVTSIGGSAFEDCSGLTSVTIPDGVTSIGDHAFCDCTGLTSIIIPDSVTSIGSSAFRFCTGLTSISIPAGVTGIGEDAFYDCCRLTSIEVDAGNPTYRSENNCLIEKETKTLVLGCETSVIPDSVTSIGDDAFRLCTGLTSITIPAGVTRIANRAFSGCSKLKSINFQGTREQWENVDKGDERDEDTGEYIVHCSDGDVD